MKNADHSNLNLHLRENIWRLFLLLPVRRRIQFAALAFFSLVGMLAEMASIGAVIPLLASLLNTGSGSCEMGILPCNLDMEFAVTLFVVTCILSAMIRTALSWSTNKYTFLLGYDMSCLLFEKTVYQSYPFHLDVASSELLAAYAKVNGLVSKTLNAILQGMVSLMFCVGILMVLLYVNSLLVILFLSVFFLLYWIIALLTKGLLSRNSVIMAATETQRIKTIQESLGGIRDLIIDNTHHVFLNRFKKQTDDWSKVRASSAFVSESPRYLVETVSILLIVGTFLFLIAGNKEAVDVIPVMGALALGAQKALPNVQRLYLAWASINSNSGNLVDVLKFLELERDSVGSQEDINFDNQAPLIEFSGVVFQYRGGRQVLDGVDLVIKRGQKIGVIGPTGSGKSTLADLVMGLLVPNQGRILICGQSLSGRNIRSWRSTISHVPQSVYLTDDTILANIAFGVEPNSVDRVRAKMAAQQAQIDQFINGLPDGIDTIVGERGARLSGGQRQRIGIARALYKHAGLLILDEATSALDEATQESLMDVVNSLDSQLTILIIAHRESTLRSCDAVYRVDGTKVNRVTLDSNVL
jgi:ATP-binding cassette, subfamily B, bacterial PglK